MALFRAAKKPHFPTYSTVALFRAATYKIHISDIINTIVELYINNSTKISYLSSLIFSKNWICINGVFSPLSRLNSETVIQIQIFCELHRKRCTVYLVKTTGTVYKKSEP